MLDSLKITRRQSEIRQQLAGLVGKEAPSEDETRSMETLDTEYRTNETRFRAALVAVFPIEIERIDGTNIFSGDYRLICSTAEVELKLSDRIECSEGTLTIMDLGKFAPDGTIIFYDMIART